MRVVVAYDIGDDSRRARVAAALSMWGDRIQQSVFECQLDPKELEEVLDRARRLIDPTRDVFQVFRQCASCRAERVDLGQAGGFEPDPYWIV